MSLPSANPAHLDTTNLHELFRDLVDFPSVSQQEGPLADAVEAVLREITGLQVDRIGDSVVARTDLGRPERVLIAGHLDTVPIVDNLPSHVHTVDGEEYLVGRGTCDMKGGVAVALYLASHLHEPNRDLTFVFYEAEEIAAEHNGLGKIAAAQPELLHADLAILMEPTDGVVEGGCQGTMRFTLDVAGQAAHSARSWKGRNAIHRLLPILQILSDWQQHDPHVLVEGLRFREGLNATMLQAGVAGNVIAPSAKIQINYRFAPDKTAAQARTAMEELFADWPMTVLDLSSPARPGLDQPLATSFVAAVGSQPGPKYGWTDVARFSELGIPALNFGSGDPMYAHKDDECCRLASLDETLAALVTWLDQDDVIKLAGEGGRP